MQYVILQPHFLMKLLPIAILPLSSSYPLSVEPPPEILQYENQQVHMKRLPTGKKLSLPKIIKATGNKGESSQTPPFIFSLECHTSLFSQSLT